MKLSKSTGCGAHNHTVRPGVSHSHLTYSSEAITPSARVVRYDDDDDERGFHQIESTVIFGLDGAFSLKRYLFRLHAPSPSLGIPQYLPN
jgi:hypothetical protein